MMRWVEFSGSACVFNRIFARVKIQRWFKENDHVVFESVIKPDIKCHRSFLCVCFANERCVCFTEGRLRSVRISLFLLYSSITLRTAKGQEICFWIYQLGGFNLSKDWRSTPPDCTMTLASKPAQPPVAQEHGLLFPSRATPEQQLFLLLEFHIFFCIMCSLYKRQCASQD